MKPGPRRKPAAELEASGAFDKNPNRRRTDGNELANQATEYPAIKKPSFLKGVASKLWNQNAAFADIRTPFDAESFATWCVLQAEFRKDFAQMQTSRLNLKRAYEERFGLNRPRAARPIEKSKDPAEKYFDDDQSGTRVQ